MSLNRLPYYKPKSMNSILVKSLPLKDVVKDLASSLEVSVINNCEEYILSIPQHLGIGTISGIDFKWGMGIITYDCTFFEPTEIKFVVDKIHPLKFLFCEEGDVVHRFENGKSLHHIEQYQNAIVASSSTHGHVLDFKPNFRTRLNSLEVDRGQFESHIDCDLHDLEGNLEDLFRDIYALNDFYYHGNYCLKIADLFIELNSEFDDHILKQLFWEGSALQILILQILQYQDRDKNAILRKVDMGQVIAAAALINNDISEYTTVAKLAHEIGLNELKLQDGFKYLYKSTVNEYVMDRRLDFAKNLLSSSEYNVSEIVELIGLTSKSYFSKIFKEKYHVSPSVFQKSKRKLN